METKGENGDCLHTQATGQKNGTFRTKTQQLTSTKVGFLNE